MTTVKIFVANQANNIYQYKNTKRKVLNCNVNIFVLNRFLKAIISKYVKKTSCVDRIYFFYIASKTTGGKI